MDSGKAVVMSLRSWRRPRRDPTDTDPTLSAISRSGASCGEPCGPSGDDGAAAAFDALVARHAREILGVAAAIVGMADGEDAAQEAIVRAWQAWPTLRDRDAFSSWVLRITVNVCRDWLRGRFGTRRRLTEPLGDVERVEGSQLAALLSSDPGGSDHAAALDLRHAIGTLPDDLRLVVALRYYAGLDATEIGAALEIPSATVRTRLRRALGLLRERLAEPGGSAPGRTGKEDARA